MNIGPRLSWAAGLTTRLADAAGALALNPRVPAANISAAAIDPCAALGLERD